MRTGKGRETGTDYSKPFVQPKRQHGTCPGVIYRAELGESLKHFRHTGIGTNTRRTTSECRVRNKLFSRNRNLESPVHSVMKATVETRMTATKQFQRHCSTYHIARRLDRCSEFTTASCVREVGYCMFPDARESRVAGQSEILEWDKFWIWQFELVQIAD